RIEALLRRSRPIRSGAVVAEFGNVIVDPVSRQVTRAGWPVALSPKEFDLLWSLLEADGAVQSRSELMQGIWGYEASVLSRTVDTHIAELRRKLEDDPTQPAYLITVRKAGYRLQR
ncbi:MAG: response regulator transcription factor, partial [Gemmatimonadaceae bacterium]